MKPFALGADLLYHSATKFLGGHGVAIGGVLVDSGRFDWEASGKFETLTAPYAGFHGMDFEEESGTRAFLLRARREGLRDFGACMAPMTAFQILQGIETLHLRMPRHVENTRKVVAFLAKQCCGGESDLSRAARVIPTTRSPRSCCRTAAARCSRSRSRAAAQAGKRFIEALRVFSHLANVGDAKSLVIHPATTTHYRMSDEDLQEGRHHRRHRAPVDRPGGRAGPDRRPRSRAEGLGKMNFEVAGKRAFAYTAAHELDPAKPTVVFVHGAGLDHSLFGLQSRYFGYHGRNVLALDLPGHGRSEGPPLPTIEEMADWISAVLKKTNTPKASIVGHSMGSLVALEFAARHPEQAERIAFCAIAFPDEGLRGVPGSSARQ